MYQTNALRLQFVSYHFGLDNDWYALTVRLYWNISDKMSTVESCYLKQSGIRSVL